MASNGLLVPCLAVFTSSRSLKLRLEAALDANGEPSGRLFNGMFSLLLVGEIVALACEKILAWMLFISVSETLTLMLLASLRPTTFERSVLDSALWSRV